MKYGYVCCCYRREWYMGPCLEQYRELGIKTVVTLGEKPFINEGKSEPLEPDRSEEIVRTYFPEVQIIKNNYSHHRDSMNAGIDALGDCDVIFVNDCDIFLTTGDWQKLFLFIEDQSRYHDMFAYDFENISKEYYYDYRFGKSARPGGYPPIMAVKNHVRMKSMVYGSGQSTALWDDKDVMIHHLRFCKGKYGGGDLYEKEPTGNLHDYAPAPQEIIDRFVKWDNILKNDRW